MSDVIKNWQPPQGFIPVESLVEGVTVFAPAPEAVPEHPESFQCPNCGATTAYNVAAGGVACEHCGYVQQSAAEVVGRAAEEFEFTLENLDKGTPPPTAGQAGWGAPRRELHCDACGADMTLAAPSSPVPSGSGRGGRDHWKGALTTTCPFCASNRVVTRAAVHDTLRPRFLIPFQVEPEQCRAVAREWLGRGWMHPGELRQSARLDQFTGVYLPFWTFDANIQSHWEAEVGYKRQKTVWQAGELKTKTVIEWRWKSGRVNVPVDDLIEAGTTKASALLLSRLYPYKLDALTAYDSSYLAGWQAQAYDVPLESAWDSAREQMREQARQASRNAINSNHVRNFSMSADFRDETWRYILLPVYLAAYRFEGQVYQVLINGQTGAIAGRKPLAWWKIRAAIAALLAPGAMCGLAGLVTLPFGGVGGIGIVLGIILFVIGILGSIELFRRARHWDKPEP